MQATHVKSECKPFDWTGSEANAYISYRVVVVKDGIRVVLVILSSQRALDATDSDSDVEAKPIIIREGPMVEEHPHPVGCTGAIECNSTNLLSNGVITRKSTNSDIECRLFGQIVREVQRRSKRADADADTVRCEFLCCVLLRLNSSCCSAQKRRGEN